MVGTVGFGLVGLSGTAGASGASPANYKNTLAKNTKGWCPAVPVNAPCDGASGDYGTIDIVSHTFSNNGGYAPSVAGPTSDHNKNKKAYGRVSGGQDGGTEGINGCSNPGNENCSGPFTLFGSAGTDSTYPAAGFTTSIAIYIDTNWAKNNPGQVVDWDTSLNNSSGNFLIDNAFNLCSTSNGGGGFYVSTSNGAGGCSTGPYELTTSGWYTFDILFDTVNGNVNTTYSILTSNTNAIDFQQSTQLAIPVATAGGPNYGWLPDEDVLGLPIAQVSLTRNS